MKIQSVNLIIKERRVYTILQKHKNARKEFLMEILKPINTVKYYRR